MTGKQFKKLYLSLGWSLELTAHNLGVTHQTIRNLTASQQVDKRTELAILYLKQKETQSNDRN